MSFSEALVQAHSDETNESALVADILRLLSHWDAIESLQNGSAAQHDRIEGARELVGALRENWSLSIDEIDELDQHSAEFRQMFEPPNEQTQQTA
jgi:hypothetical protein